MKFIIPALAITTLLLSTSASATVIYLNDDAGLSVSLNSGVLSGGSLAEIIDVDNATDSDPHNAVTGNHAYISGNGAQMDLRFDLGATYDLQTAHLWNIEEAIHPNWGVTAMKIEFFDFALSSLGIYDSPAITSGGNDNPFAESFDLGGITGVKYVDVLLTGGLDGVDITNFGFTTVSAVPAPPVTWLFGAGLLGLAGIARYNKSA